MVQRSILPSTWVTVGVGDVAEIIMGQSPPGRSYNQDNEGYPLIAGAGDLGEIFPKPSKWTSEPTRISQENDIIFCIRATIGILNWADGEYCLGRGVAAIRPETSVVVPEYLYFWLHSAKLQFERLGTGSTFLQIRRQDIENAQFPLPTLPEQRRIVEILRQADELQKLHQEANALSEALTQAIFFDIFGDPASNEKQWDTAILEDITTRVTDGTHQSPDFQNEGIPFIFVSNIVDGTLDLTTSKYISFQTYESLMARCPVQVGDILYSTVGSYGVAVTVDTEMPFAFQRHIAHIKPDHKLVDPGFLKSLLNTPYVRQQADRKARGVAQKTVNLNEIRNFEIIVPPLDIQQEFSNSINRVNSIRSTQSTAQKLTQELLQSLTSRAFIGSLTNSWRKQNHDEVSSAAIDRDRALGLRKKQPTVRDYIEGAVTQAEREEITRSLSEMATPALEQLAASITLPFEDLLPKLEVGAFAELSKLVQSMGAHSPELIRPGLLESIGALSEADLKALATGFQSFGAADIAKEFTINLVNQLGGLARLALSEADPSDPRYYILRELGTIQMLIYSITQSLTGYFTPQQVQEATPDLDVVQVQKSLQFLGEIGLIASVSIPDGRGRYVTAYRNLRPEDDVRADELSELEKIANEA